MTYRGDLPERKWRRLQPSVGRPAHDHRRIINGILWLKRLRAAGELAASSYHICRAVLLARVRDVAETGAWVRGQAET